MQHTLQNNVEIEGIGLHSGCNVRLVLKPAEANTGIVFKRVDQLSQPLIPALFLNVVDTGNCTCVGDNQGNRVSTIEHLMSAIVMCGIDNVLIEINNQEVPIMDGSAAPIYEILSKAKLQEQELAKKRIRVMKKITYVDEKGNSVSLLPTTENNLHINFSIDFPSPIVGHQVFSDYLTVDTYIRDIAPCRTFCEKYQVDYLKSIGLIKGGSLDNAVVLDGDKILNEEGFRVKNECVNHKVLDDIGDLYTAGCIIYGQYQANKTGHRHNNELLKLLFANSENYQII